MISGSVAPENTWLIFVTVVLLLFIATVVLESMVITTVDDIHPALP